MSTFEKETEIRHILAERPASCRKEVRSSVRKFLKRHIGYVARDEIREVLAPQSSSQVDGTPTGGSDSTHVENVDFISETAGDFAGSTADIQNPNAMASASSGMDLGQFHMRPVRILEVTVTDSDTVPSRVSVSPWSAVMQHPAIQRKLDNFAFIRGNLCIEAVVNATQFSMGAFLIDYQPLTTTTPTTIFDDTGANALFSLTSRTQRDNIICYYSGSRGGTMKLPFFYPKDWLRLGETAEITQMGLLTGSQMVALSSANGQAGIKASINIFAWLEDVELSGSTLNLAAQASSRSEYDPSRPLSTTASAVAAAASHLKRLPVIGRFATATEMGAKLLAAGFAAFGFTNVPVIGSISALKPTGAPPLASTEIGFPSESLTLDPKCELSIDPAIAGLQPNDALAIQHVVTREAYLTSTVWSDSMAEDTLIFYAGICPAYWNWVAHTGYNAFWPVPMAWASDLFQFWRGDIILRLVAVCTPFHKGRLRVTYDPQGDLRSTADLTTECYTQILDLSETQEVEIRVPYRQALHWLKNPPIQNTNFWSTSSSPGNNLHFEGYTNGSISVRVLTQLQGPVTPASFNIQVFVRAAENFEFAGMNEEYLTGTPNTVFTPQATPQKETSLMGNTTSGPPPNQYLEYIGEAVTSLRQVLRRSTISYVENTLSLSTTNLITGVLTRRQTRFPLAYGFDPNGASVANEIVGGSTAPFNFVGRHPMAWIMPAYVGVRGSTSWNYIVDGATSLHAVTTFRDPFTATSAAWNTFAAFTTTGIHSRDQYARALALAEGTGSGGQAVTSQPTQNSLSVRYPFVSQYKFQGTAPSTYFQADTNADNRSHNVTVQVNAPVGAFPLFMRAYAAAGTDFDLLKFLNAPTIYQSAIPTAV